MKNVGDGEMELAVFFSDIYMPFGDSDNLIGFYIKLVFFYTFWDIIPSMMLNWGFFFFYIYKTF